MQETISPPQLSTTLLFDVLWRWSLYLNRCVAALALESLDTLGCHVLLFLDPILAELEGGRYVVPILPASLADMLQKTGGKGSNGYVISIGSGGGGDGATTRKIKSSPTGGARGCRCVTIHTCPP